MDVGRQVDLNRFVSRASRYRKALRAAFKKEKPSILLDIHSFPPDRALQFRVDPAVAPDIVFLTGPNPRSLALSRRLARAIRAKQPGLVVSILKGSRANDVMREFADTPATLIEFSESLAQQTLVWDDVISAIARTVSSLPS